MGSWFEEAVFYHMYPIGMTGAPRKNEGTEVVHRFDSLMKWLPHIKELGCTAIYIGPLFESSTHGYDTRDYRVVDKRLGDNEDFKKFKRDLLRLINDTLKKCPHISKEQLLKNMGFPENWDKILRYKK